MRRYLVTGALALMGVALSSARAEAQTVPGFTVNRFEPSERGSDWFALESLDLRNKGTIRPAFGVVGEWVYRPLVIYKANDDVKSSVVRNQFNLHPGLSVLLWDRIRVAASIPVGVYQDGHTGTVNGGATYASPPNEQALGDLRLGLDFRLLGQYGDAFTAALGAQLWLPTGDQANYMSDGVVGIAPRVSFAGDVGALAYAAKVGFKYRDVATNGSELNFAASIGARMADGKLVIGPEIFGSTTTSDGANPASDEDDPFGKLTTPVEGILGGHYTAGDIKFGAGVGTGLTRGFGSPVLRTLATLEYMPAFEGAPPPPADRDHDGVVDGQDACPDVAGDKSEDPKKNGCPADRDGDGVLDRDDACIDVAGVKTDDPATNGCPADQDKDGIADNVDSCPDVAGVKSDDPKKNGCPPDSDGDGIPDKDDACPDKPGKADADPKKNGCPENPDLDGDGILNKDDACPNEPGKPDPDAKKNGCPKAFLKDGQVKILDQVKFKTGSAQIDAGKDSQDILTAVLGVINAHPEIKTIKVEGHTDNKGNPAANKKLSGDRAASVVKWLIGKGVDKNKLSSEGFGQDRPIGDNKTDEGRKENRRVEFHVEM